MKTKTKLLCAALALAFACTACTPSGSLPESTEPPAAAVPLAAVTAVENPYTDVPNGTWYTDAVLWCREHEIMGGTSNTTFSPDDTMSRAMLATVLYRAEGEPAVSGGASFTDVPDGQWYSKAAAWASANEYITGYGNGLFGTDDPVTREQTVTILWRYSGQPEAAAEDFADESDISSFARTAVDWASSSGVVEGVGDNRFAPQGELTRAQAAVILQRYLTGREVPSDPGEGGTSTVYFTSDISSEGMMAVYEALGVKLEGDNIAVKLSTGEPPASNYLRPELIRDVVEAVDGTIVECNTAYGGSRSETAMHYQVAKDHGFTELGKGFVIMDEDGSMVIPVEGGQRLTENYVGAHFGDFDGFLVLSHFKGHMIAGYGGALKNISIGIGSQEGKNLIHTAGRSHTSWFGGEQDAFLESMADAGKSVVDYLDGNILFINVMNRLSIDCDCNGNPAEPDIHDIGILASTDPVALDQACLDLIYQAEGNESFVRRVEGQHGVHVLEAAEEIGLGSRTYELVNID